MGLFAEFDVISDFGYLDMTEEYCIIPDYSEGCQVFVDSFIKYSRQMVPVLTGYLRSTLTANCSDTSCSAETDCDYAQYVEYGTSYMGAQPYFEPALEMALLEAEPFWNQAEQDALMEEQMLAAEEEMMQQAMMQSAGRGGGDRLGPQGAGQLNFSSFGAFIGSLLGMLLTAIIVTTVQVIMGKDFSSKSGRGSGGGNGGIFIPEVIIT